MSTGARLSLAGLVVAGTALLVGVAMVPTHVSFGAGSLRCGTVLRPDRGGEIASFCGPAGANHLRAALVVSAVVAVLALIPVIVASLRPGGRPIVWAAWGIITVLVAVVGVARLGMVEYTPDAVFVDL